MVLPPQTVHVNSPFAAVGSCRQCMHPLWLHWYSQSECSLGMLALTIPSGGNSGVVDCLVYGADISLLSRPKKCCIVCVHIHVSISDASCYVYAIMSLVTLAMLHNRCQPASDMFTCAVLAAGMSTWNNRQYRQQCHCSNVITRMLLEIIWLLLM